MTRSLICAAAAVALMTGSACAQGVDAPKNPPQASIAGLWHTVNTLPDGTFFLEAYTMWHRDGTFEEAANRDPRTADAPALGVWTQSGNTVNLSLAVAWLYDTNGNYVGKLNLTETYKVKDGANKLVGTFDAKFYDTKGNLLQEVTGGSKADRLGG